MRCGGRLRLLRGDRDACRRSRKPLPDYLLPTAQRWIEAFRRVRGETERRAAPLSAEDQAIQSMPDASPTKWHRAHTTWFFETFLLQPNVPGYKVFDERFAFLFNSYYVAAGPRHARPKRGLITRPNAAEVAEYRAHVDAAVETPDRRGEQRGAGPRSRASWKSA